jgi:hypothetical protein
MAATYELSECTVLKKNEGSYSKAIILPPSTASADETVDLTPLIADGQLLGVTEWNVEGGAAVTEAYDVATGYLTLDSGGAGASVTYACEVKYVGYNFTP